MKVQKGSIYFRLLSTFLLLSVSIIAVASMVFYSLFHRVYINEVASSLKKSIEYEAEWLEADIFSRTATLIQDLSLNVSYAETLSEIINYSEPSSVALLRAHRLLSSVGSIYNSTIASVIIYYPQNSILLSSNMGYKRLEAPYNEEYRKFVDELPDPSGLFMQWDILHTTSDLPGLQDSHVLLYSAARWEGVTTSRNAMIILALKDSFLSDKLDYVASPGGEVYILAEDGAIISRSSNSSEALPWKEPWGKPLFADGVASAESPDGMLYISAPINPSPWRLVYATPADNFSEASAEIARIMLFIVPGSLLISFIFTVLFSKRLYTPIRALVDVAKSIQPVSSTDEYSAIRTVIDTLSSNLSNAQRLEQKYRPVLRNMLIHDLLLGMLAIGDKSDEAILTAGIELPHAILGVMIVEWCERDMMACPAEQRGTIPFALREQLEDARLKDARVYSYLPSRMRIVLLINAPEESNELIAQLADRAKAHLSNDSIRCMSAFGGWTDQLSSLSRIYQSARLNMEFRIMCPPDSAMVSAENGAFVHPALEDTENRFIDCIRERRVTDGHAALRQLAELWETLSPITGYRSLMRISSMLQEQLLRVQAHPGAEISKLITDPKSVLWSINEYEEAMRSKFFPMIADGGTAQSRNELLLEKTIAYINEHISEDLSLESISNEMHFNPKYFSRLFKELSGTTLSDFISRKRLMLASKMLLENALSIEEISRSVGYSNGQYFSRRFKDEYGMSPREYRLRANEKTEKESP